MERERFLEQVAAARGRAVLEPSQVPTGGPPDLDEVDLVEHFAARLRSVDGVDHGPLPYSAVPEVVAGILTEFEPGEFLAWDEPGVGGVSEAIRALGWQRADGLVPEARSGRRDHQLSYLGMVAGITGADAGLAESGSIVLRSGPGRPRMASLIPLVHIALLPVARLYRSWPHYVAEHPAAASGVSNLVVITGPSRTGDIEQQLTLGVHGPRHLHVVLVQ